MRPSANAMRKIPGWYALKTFQALNTVIRAVILGVAALLLTFAGPNAAHAAAIAVTATNDELNTDGDCSLREAIQAANTDTGVDSCLSGNGADTIMVPAGTYTLSLPSLEDSNTSGDLDIVGDLTIHGAGAASTIIDGGDIDRVFDVQIGANVAISGLTITNGSSGPANDGGGIRNAGTLTVNSSVIDRNWAGNNDSYESGASGGEIFNSGVLTLIDTAVSDNDALDGGGIVNTGSMVLTRSTISDCWLSTEMGRKVNGDFELISRAL